MAVGSATDNSLVRRHWTLPMSCPGFNINSFSQKFGCFQCLSVSFLLLPMLLSRSDFNKKTPVDFLMSENPVTNPDCMDIAARYHGYSLIKIV